MTWPTPLKRQAKTKPGLLGRMYNPPPVIGICSWEVFFPNPAIQQPNLEPVQIPNGQNTEDTTAVSLAWTMHFLARHPEVQAKARQEACENSRKISVCFVS